MIAVRIGEGDGFEQASWDAWAGLVGGLEGGGMVYCGLGECHDGHYKTVKQEYNNSFH